MDRSVAHDQSGARYRVYTGCLYREKGMFCAALKPVLKPGPTHKVLDRRVSPVRRATVLVLVCLDPLVSSVFHPHSLTNPTNSRKKNSKAEGRQKAESKAGQPGEGKLGKPRSKATNKLPSSTPLGQRHETQTRRTC